MKECDLVMEGGITSGVVYPLALVELASQYRFRGVGGTSAGAIAAGLAAAAEYDSLRNGQDPDKREDRVFLPTKAGAGIAGRRSQPQICRRRQCGDSRVTASWQAERFSQSSSSTSIAGGVFS